MDLLSEEEKELIRLFENKVQIESFRQNNSNRLLQKQEEKNEFKENIKDFKQSSSQKYSSMFGGSMEYRNQRNDNKYNNMSRDQFNINREDDMWDFNNRGSISQEEQPLRSLNPIIFNNFQTHKNETEEREKNSQTYQSNQTNDSYFGNSYKNHNDKIQNNIKYINRENQYETLKQQQTIQDKAFYSVDQNKSKQNLNQQYSQQVKDMNGFTFKPPIHQKIQDIPKDKKITNSKDTNAKQVKRGLKSEYKQDSTNKPTKKLSDQSFTQRYDSSDKKGVKKQNTQRPQSSRPSSKQIQNNNSNISINYNSSQYNQQEQPMKQQKTLKYNSNSSHMNNSNIINQISKDHSKSNIKKEESGVKNSAIYKSGSKKQDSNLMKNRSSSLYISNKDLNKEKQDNERKRSNSKSKRKISVQSVSQIKTDRSKISSSNSKCKLKKAQSKEKIIETDNHKSKGHQLLNVLNQNQGESTQIMLKIIEDHLNDCQHFQEKIGYIINEQINYNNNQSN